MANKFNLKICLTITILLLLRIESTKAATITIGPGASYDFDNIQSGIDAAVYGDTVLVAPAEYIITVPISYQGKAITVKSETGPNDTTIRMGTPTDINRGSVVIFENNETSESVLDGFTITGGTGFRLFVPEKSEYDWCGGGIYFANASSATVRNCAIVQNRAEYAGGGVECWSSSATLTNCTIADNTSAYGGGIATSYGSSVTMTDCIVRANTAVEGLGGGLIVFNASVIMTNCNIAENSADVGGGVFGGENSLVTMSHCAIISNTAYKGGGGMETWHQTHMSVSNCVIVLNTSLSLGGGGVNCSIQGSATIINSIIWGNTAPKGREIWVRNAGILSISYSNVSGGQAEATIEGGTLNWGEGNIDADPLFTNPGYWSYINDANIIVEPNDPNAVWVDGDYHLKSQAGRWHPVSESWVVDDVTSPCIDTGDPNSPVGDEPEPNGERINMGAYGGTAEASMSSAGAEQFVYVQWLGHSTVKVWTDDCVVYIDPERVPESLHDATLVCVTHTHGDHYSPTDIAKVSNAQTQFIAPPDVVQRYGSGQTIAPGQTIEFDFVSIKAVPSYNVNKSNHPRSNNWLGYIIELAGKRVYVAGDTDLIEEMKILGDINVAFLPAGGTYTMNAIEAAEATGYIKPDLAIPYHWGQSVGTLSDAQRFVELALCPAMVLTVGEMIGSDNWPEYSPLIAHWALDEAEGEIAHDIVGENHGTTSGDPTWQPASGKIDGALLLDGIDDYFSTNFVLDPADDAFSVFAWIKGGAPYQVIISQADILAGRSTKPGSIWLCVDPLNGKLMTYLGLASAGSPIPPAPLLMSESVITDCRWHHVGFIWNCSYRSLYVDGIETARDTAAQNPLQSATGGLRIGASNYLEAGNFFSGLIDDVRIYNAALTTEQVKEFAN